jgi:integrase
LSFQRYETADGTRWRVRWRDEDGTMHSRSFLSRNDARGFDADIKARKFRGDVLPKAGKQTLAGAYDEWKRVRGRRRAAATLDAYEASWKAHIKGRFDHHRIGALAANPMLVEEFIAELEDDGVGPAATRKSLTVLSAVLTFCVKAHKISANPVLQAEKPPATPLRNPRPFPPIVVEQIRRELAARQTKAANKARRLGDACFVSMLSYGGLRPGEALALTFGDIKAQTISVDKGVQQDQDGKPVLGPTKTKKPRSAPLVSPLAEDLAEWRGARGDPPDTALVFPDPSGGYWARGTYNNWRARVWGAAVKAVAERDANLAWLKDARPYDCRASFISLQILAGVNPVQVAKWAGHSTRVMFDHYTGVIEELAGGEDIPPEVQLRNARLALVEEPEPEVRNLVAESLKPPSKAAPRARRLLYGRR